MKIKTLTTYLQNQKTKLGTLATKNQKIYFEYDKEFLKTGIEISPYKLPLKAGLHRCDDDVFDGLWGVFADSLPDGWGRLLIDRHFINMGINPHTLTPLDRLAHVGSHAMGALHFEPQIEVAEGVHDVHLDALFMSSQEILKGSGEALLDELLVLGGSSAGARPKVLVQLHEESKEIVYGADALKSGFSHAIVKFASSLDTPEIGAIEYAYSLMAQKAGLEMCKTSLIEGKKGRYFASERFDRLGDERVHMHSLAGLTHTDFRYPTLDYDDILSLTLHLTKNMQEVKKAFRLATFNLLTHNRDDHAKNFSYLMDEKGVWRFSPAYDLTFSYGPGGEHSTMYLGEGKHPTQEHLLTLAKKHGIKDAKQIIEEVKSAVSQWSMYAKEAELNPNTAREIEKAFVV